MHLPVKHLCPWRLPELAGLPAGPWCCCPCV
jgi:hypothetical protein